MNIRETLIDGDPDRYEQCYAIHIGKVLVQRLIRRPIAIPPPDATLCFVDDGPRHERIDRQAVSVWKDGAWKRLSFVPTHYVMLDD